MGKIKQKRRRVKARERNRKKGANKEILMSISRPLM